MSDWDAGLDMLKEELSYLYGRDDHYRAFVREVGLGEQNILFTGKATTDWSNILEEAQKKHKIMDIVIKATGNYPDRFVLQVMECYIKSRGDSDITILPAGLDEDTTKVFECKSRVRQTIQILVCWNETLIKMRKTKPSLSIFPEDYLCIHLLMSQLEKSFQKTHRFFAQSDLSRSAFEIHYYEFIRNFESTEQQINEVLTKMQEFQDTYDNSSIISFELEEYIQQELAKMIQNLHEADGWISLWLRRFLTAKGTSSNEATDHSGKGFSRDRPVIDFVNAVKSTDLYRTNISPVNNAIETKAITDAIATDSVQIARDSLEKALSRYYDSDGSGFTRFCSTLADKFQDRSLRKMNLRGNKVQDKITHLLDYIQDKGFYSDFAQYAMRNMPNFDKILRECPKNEI